MTGRKDPDSHLTISLAAVVHCRDVEMDPRDSERRISSRARSPKLNLKFARW